MNHRGRIIIVVAVLLIIGVAGFFAYRHYRATHISTDDAFVEGRIHVVAPKVSGTVRAVYVDDNQPVKAGELLVELDPADYDVKAKEAASALESEKMKSKEVESRLEASEKQRIEIKAAVEAAKANVALQKANVSQATLDLKRYESLYAREAVPRERFEKTRTAFDVAQAQLRAAEEHVRQLEASLATQTSVIKQAQAALAAQTAAIRNKEAVLATAELNRGYTKIVSPANGYVTKKSVQVGNQVGPGTPMLAVVPLDDIWIVANYKETQLGGVKRGQRVRIKVDTYPGRRWHGKVESIMAGTGASFSLFPPENATGNYVKVVQRVPVKIVLDKDSDKEHILRIGMSVVPTILVE